MKTHEVQLADSLGLISWASVVPLDGGECFYMVFSRVMFSDAPAAEVFVGYAPDEAAIRTRWRKIRGRLPEVREMADRLHMELARAGTY